MPYGQEPVTVSCMQEGNWKKVTCDDCGWKPVAGEPATTQDVTYVDPATCRKETFREFVAFVQDGTNTLGWGGDAPNQGITNTGGNTWNAVNYGTVLLPGNSGNGFVVTCDDACSDTTDNSCWFSTTNGYWKSTSQTTCTQGYQPTMPTFSACAGQQVRFRVLHPGGDNTNNTFEVFGHSFLEAPYMTPANQVAGESNPCESLEQHSNLYASQHIGQRSMCGSTGWLLADPPEQGGAWTEPLVDWRGGQMGIGPSNHFDLVIQSAGGPFAQPGSYLYKSYSVFHLNAGVWGIFQVDECGPKEALAGALTSQDPDLGLRLRTSLGTLPDSSGSVPFLYLLPMMETTLVTRQLLASILGLCWLAVAGPAAADPSAAAEDPAWRVEHEGIVVEMSIEAVNDPGGPLREEESASFRFGITDTATGQPLGGLYPAAWMAWLADGESRSPAGCIEKVEEFIGGSILAQPELDLNVYYVLALNEDATITVVDPLFGFGGTKLLGMINLPARGKTGCSAPIGRGSS